MTLLREEPQVGSMQSALRNPRPCFEFQEAGQVRPVTQFSGDWLSQAGAEETAWASLS